MKAFFMTVGPSSHKWVEQVGDESKFLLSAGQWHNELNYDDPVFGKTAEYSKKYEVFHGAGILPTYVSAGASAAVYTIMVAIKNAFVECNLSLTGGDVDQLLFNTSALVCEGVSQKGMTG